MPSAPPRHIVAVVGEDLRLPSPRTTSGAGGLRDPGIPGDGDREAAAARGDDDPERPPLPAFCVGDGVPFLSVAVGDGVDRECFAPAPASTVPAELPIEALRV